MIELDEKKIEEFLETVATKRHAQPVEADERDKIDRQFADKLARLEQTKQLDTDVLDKLRVLWKLWREPKTEMTWQQRALVVTALTYFISPFDLVPDVAGKHGYRDDALVVRIVYRRLGNLVGEESSTR